MAEYLLVMLFTVLYTHIFIPTGDAVKTIRKCRLEKNYNDNYIYIFFKRWSILPIRHSTVSSECLHKPGYRAHLLFSSHPHILQKRIVHVSYRHGLRKPFYGQTDWLTDIQTAVFHLQPVFQVHRPHVAVKQTGWVRNGVSSRTEKKQTDVLENH